MSTDQKISTVEVQAGELVDKITILEIKTERIHDENKLKNIRLELGVLLKTFYEFNQTPKLLELKNELKKRNEALWEIEDAIRDKEVEGRKNNYFEKLNNLEQLKGQELVDVRDFLKEFVSIARSVYYRNDERCQVKREINEHLGSRLLEEKSYKEYKA
ncbi:hypothetical protein HN446_03775 [bacterium]|nr:hypothetical protein [bacterium]